MVSDFVFCSPFDCLSFWRGEARHDDEDDDALFPLHDSTILGRNGISHKNNNNDNEDDHDNINSNPAHM